MLYLQVACPQKFQMKIFFMLLVNMECCYQSVKILEEMIHSKYQAQPLNFQYFSFCAV